MESLLTSSQRKRRPDYTEVDLVSKSLSELKMILQEPNSKNEHSTIMHVLRTLHPAEFDKAVKEYLALKFNNDMDIGLLTFIYARDSLKTPKERIQKVSDYLTGQLDLVPDKQGRFAFEDKKSSAILHRNSKSRYEKQRVNHLSSISDKKLNLPIEKDVDIYRCSQKIEHTDVESKTAVKVCLCLKVQEDNDRALYVEPNEKDQPARWAVTGRLPCSCGASKIKQVYVEPYSIVSWPKNLTYMHAVMTNGHQYLFDSNNKDFNKVESDGWPCLKMVPDYLGLENDEGQIKVVHLSDIKSNWQLSHFAAFIFWSVGHDVKLVVQSTAEKKQKLQSLAEQIVLKSKTGNMSKLNEPEVETMGSSVAAKGQWPVGFSPGPNDLDSLPFSLTVKEPVGIRRKDVSTTLSVDALLNSRDVEKSFDKAYMYCMTLFTKKENTDPY